MSTFYIWLERVTWVALAISVVVILRLYGVQPFAAQWGW